MIDKDKIKFSGYLFLILLLSFIFTLLISPNTIKIGVVSSIVIFSGIIFLFQWISFIHSYYLNSEYYFDLVGSMTFVLIIISAFLLSDLKDLRSILLFSIIVIWGIRLGSFLFFRIRSKGFDDRFSLIRTDFFKLLFLWNLQGMWILFSISPALISLLSEKKNSMDFLGYLGFSVWVLGFFLEVVADYQKMIFRSKKENKNKFIKLGLWAYVRHPNYLGEIILWFGISIICFPVLIGWQLLSLLSPIFVTILLIKISGVPILEENNKKRWGDNIEYLNYINNTPMIIPRILKKKK
ncbi:MAG: hypothetical protein CL764_02470 [Chloroflexi bacterium]|nr:hypothetical protein [Chloroflexota bacterium]|tara:strand:- start:6223 stop:7107 length:885 start_codon:yes stop_codon:yes gene_type:complete